jgi:hypothetical protein
VVLTTANFGGFSNFCRYYTRSQTGKSIGYRPTLKPLIYLFWHLKHRYPVSEIDNHISDVMVGVFAWNAVNGGFDPRRGQTKDYNISSCYFSTKHASLRNKSKDWLTLNWDNVSKWSDRLLFLWASTKKKTTKCVGVV